MPRKLLKRGSTLFFGAFVVFVFLGLDSKEKPTTFPYITAGAISGAVSLLLAVLGQIWRNSDK
jgi:hypothetical protein